MYSVMMSQLKVFIRLVHNCLGLIIVLLSSWRRCFDIQKVCS